MNIVSIILLFFFIDGCQNTDYFLLVLPLQTDVLEAANNILSFFFIIFYFIEHTWYFL